MVGCTAGGAVSAGTGTAVGCTVGAVAGDKYCRKKRSVGIEVGPICTTRRSTIFETSREKTNSVACEQVYHKPGCTQKPQSHCYFDRLRSP